MENGTKLRLLTASLKTAVQIPTNEAFLPLLPEEETEIETNSQVEYIFEPNREEIVENILPSALKIQLCKASNPAATRLSTEQANMHSAAENAGELLNDLKISYNKARQGQLLLRFEIVAGSEALEG